MQPKPGQPAQEQPAAPPEEPAEAQPERFGPLLLRRLRKDDGRALILYSADGDEPA